MPPPRAASSSALTGPKSHAHARRPSRIPLSASTLSIPLPPSPPSTPPPKFPPNTPAILLPFFHLLHFLTPKPTRKFLFDQRLALQLRSRPFALLRPLLLLFFLLFLFLFLLLRSLLGVANPVLHTPPTPLIAYRSNLARVNRGDEPKELWPHPDALALALTPPAPVLSPVSLELILSTRAASRRGWRHHPRDKHHDDVRVSVIAACQDRSAFLQTALPGWCRMLGQHDEIVIVDWGTRAPDHVPVRTVVEAVGEVLEGISCEVRVVSVAEAGSWVLTRAYNLAARFARGEWLMKLDCDTMVVEEGILGRLILPGGEVEGRGRSRLPARGEEERFFYRYFWEKAKTENEEHLNGVFLARTEDFRRVNGYDERITTYGWDDSELYSRLERGGAGEGMGLRALEFEAGSLKHMKHGDGYRGANQHLVMGPTLETQVNQQATEVLPSWSEVGTVEETEYEYDLLSKDGRYAGARIVRTPRGLLEHLSRQEQTGIIDEATNRLLHDVYGFPWSVLGEINRSRGELVRSLALLGRSTHWESGNGFIFAEVGGTVPQRVLGMASAIGLAMEYERPLFLAWSSGTREEPTPRVTDFFDVDSSGVVDEEMEDIGGRRRKGARVYQVGRWKCRSLVEVCAKTDSAFDLMTEFRSGGHENEKKAGEQVLDVLHGKVAGKRNVLLRLEGAFPVQKMEERMRAMASLMPSHGLADHLGKLGDLSEHLGIYIGHAVKQRGVDAMVKRVEGHYGASEKYFVSGGQREMVVKARGLLRVEENMVESARNIETAGATHEIRETTRDIAELYALAHCKSLVNDGRPPSAVLEIIKLLRRNN